MKKIGGNNGPIAISARPEIASIFIYNVHSLARRATRTNVHRLISRKWAEIVPKGQGHQSSPKNKDINHPQRTRTAIIPKGQGQQSSQKDSNRPQRTANFTNPVHNSNSRPEIDLPKARAELQTTGKVERTTMRKLKLFHGLIIPTYSPPQMIHVWRYTHCTYVQYVLVRYKYACLFRTTHYYP